MKLTDLPWKLATWTTVACLGTWFVLRAALWAADVAQYLVR